MGCLCWDSVFINKTIIAPYKIHCTQGWNIDTMNHRYYTWNGIGNCPHTPIDHNCFRGVPIRGKLTLCHRNCIVQSAASILA